MVLGTEKGRTFAAKLQETYEEDIINNAVDAATGSIGTERGDATGFY